MAYRNKTFVSFASEDIQMYWMMKAWRKNQNIEFSFHDAHDLNTALDTSQPDTIRRRLRERLANTKQVVLLVGDKTRAVAANPGRFLFYEVETIDRLDLPVVFVNLNQSRVVQSGRLPAKLASRYSVSVSYQPAIIRYALDEFVAEYPMRSKTTPEPHHYRPTVYTQLGL